VSDEGEAAVLITRTPLRISIGGGGTDLASYYRRSGALVVSAAINKYVFISINRTFVDDYFIKYSALERATTADQIEHPIVREAVRLTGVGPGVEIVSMADIPAGTGLGSSGTFTVGLLRALYAFKREHITASALAEEACHIEIDLLGQPVGKQDQYIAAFGGLTCFEFHADDRVTVSPLAISNQTLHDLEEHLLLFFTGYARAASAMLDDQKRRSEAGDASMLESLEFTDQLGRRIKTSLEGGDTAGFAALMHEHWEYKRSRTAGMSNDEIDHWYTVGLDHGALGGKLVGAGAGGFLLFYADDPARLRKAMAAEGLSEVRFFFDHDGSTVLVRD
jgi:D-glycero-alpha-D-manno-heptose-7-phosphate kinase